MSFGFWESSDMPPKRGRGRGRGEVPPKNEGGRGRGRGGPPRGSSQEFSPGQTSSQRDQPCRDRYLENTAVQQGSAPQSSTIPREPARRDFVPSSSGGTKSKTQNTLPKELGMELKYKSPIIPDFPARPGFGQEGRSIRLTSNCYPIKIPSGCVYHYDVEVIKCNPSKDAAGGDKEMKCARPKINRQVISVMLETDRVFRNSYAAYDGRKNLYTRQALKTDFPHMCNVILPDENPRNPNNSRGQNDDSYRIIINTTSSHFINLDTIHEFFNRKTTSVPLEAIMAVETILRHGPCLRFTPIGRSFYHPSDPPYIIEGGLEIWMGYHQSIRLCQWKPTVNLDTVATTFWQGSPVLDFIADSMNMKVENLHNITLHNNDIDRMNKKLKEKDIYVTHLPYRRKYRVLQLRRVGANSEKIRGDDVTVSRYFETHHGRTLMYPKLPCLQVKPEIKKVFIPVEFCVFTAGQHNKAELTSSQRASMIEFTSKPPHVRFKKIQDCFDRTANFNNDKCVQKFDLNVSRRPLSVDARVINAPRLEYKNKNISPRDGSWNVRDTHFLEGAEISKWIIIRFTKYLNVDSFAKLFVDIGKKLGMRINGQNYDSIFVDMRCDKKKLFSNLKKDGFELAIIIIPRLGDDERTSYDGKVITENSLYAEIKKEAEISIGLTTQCIKEDNFRAVGGKRGPQIVNNLCLKINPKMGGENNSLLLSEIPSVLKEPVIIIGADVNHPPPTQLNQPSIVACVGSLDSISKRFAVSIRLQENSHEQKRKQEVIGKDILTSMVCELLFQFYRHTHKQKPRKIIFYRDGVSEGELIAVKKQEFAAVRAACKELQQDNYEPGITFIVVQKRHHVRFMPEDRNAGAGRMGNIPPGTVVDTEVTHPVNFDFFLCSQLGIQGTSRPSHYTVLHDDNNFSADDLQKLTYQFCHMSVRCTKSISIPAPVYYADLVAFRARKHLESERSPQTSGNRNSGRSFRDSGRLTQADKDAITITDNLKSSMYFV